MRKIIKINLNIIFILICIIGIYQNFYNNKSTTVTKKYVNVRLGNNKNYDKTNQQTIKEGWYQEENEYYYYSNGNKVTGLQTIDNKTYYFAEDGKIKTGFVDIGNDTYFFSRIYKYALTGWVENAEGTWYQDVDGKLIKGLQTIDGKKYYFGKDGKIKTGFIDEGEDTYFFSRIYKYALTGWVENAEGAWYQDEDGKLIKGLQILDGKKYYFGKDGKIKTGFIRLDNNLYFFSRPKKYALTGWVENAEGIWYQDKDGVVYEKDGIEVIDGKEYYFQNHFAKTGLVVINNERYYFNKKYYYKEYNNVSTQYANYYIDSNTGIIKKIQRKPVYYNQKDNRWGNIIIGNTRFGSSGCVPTSLAMAFTAIKEREILPIEIGYYLYYNTDQFNKRLSGASGMAVIYASQAYGVNYKNIYTKEQLKSELEKGNIVYGSMQDGKFATKRWNHAIIVYDYDGERVRTIASDPLNIYNNGWVDIDLIWNQKNTDPDDLTGGSALYSLS